MRQATLAGLRLAVLPLALALGACVKLDLCGDDPYCGRIPNYDEPRPAAVDTVQRFAAIGLGDWHACMLTATGAAWCWGSNEYGQLGAPAPQRCVEGVGTPCSAQPLGVSGGHAFASLVASHRFTCALTAAGAAWCWGNGDFTQDNNDKVPLEVAGGHVFTQIAASLFANMACGLKADGSLWCWGVGFAYGSNGPAPSVEPARWTGASGVVFRSIAIGEAHACGLDAAGQAWCIGSNGYGQLGSGGASSAVPVPVAGGRVYSEIVTGPSHSCALTPAGQAWCWGLGNAVGDGAGSSVPPRETPVAVAGGLRFAHLSAGTGRTCGLAADGGAWCWGDGYGGVLGDGSTEPRAAPVAVLAPPLVALAAGGVVTCGIDAAGVAWCWGGNESGAVGRPVVGH